jgi:hypothetical protein
LSVRFEGNSIEDEYKQFEATFECQGLALSKHIKQIVDAEISTGDQSHLTLEDLHGRMPDWKELAEKESTIFRCIEAGLFQDSTDSLE